MTYPPPYYTTDDPAFTRRIMQDHAFAVLVTDDMAATQLPLIWHDEGRYGALYGHMSRQNPIALRLAKIGSAKALAIFTGPHAYISATHYDDPMRSVPTWNYATVQARGRLMLLPDDEIGPHLAELAETYEGGSGWSLSDAPDYVSALKNGIVAVRLEINALQAFRKMSGNKRPAIRKRVIEAARKQGNTAFADEMETLS